ncbi:MAG: gamma-glutamylcyclotransferase [Rhodobacteraceae bacterium]|nr:gamma-glutamylcyclotransferase [Paracoccaceae bacterium]
MTITYFGYGSLVNVNTLSPQAKAQPGTLRGWVREWRIISFNAEGQGVCSLTVTPSAEHSIRGVSVREPASGLGKLDKRENGYNRINGVGDTFSHDPIDGLDASDSLGAPDLFLYRAKPENYTWGCEQNPILQSYVDCVLAGFYAFWGEDGVDHFIETTRGWDRVPVLQDRENPIYPRAVVLEKPFLEMIDRKLQAVNIRSFKR